MKVLKIIISILLMIMSGCSVRQFITDNSKEQDINKARWYFNWVNEKIDCIDNLGYRGLMLYTDINNRLKVLDNDNC